MSRFFDFKSITGHLLEIIGVSKTALPFIFTEYDPKKSRNPKNEISRRLGVILHDFAISKSLKNLAIDAVLAQESTEMIKKKYDTAEGSYYMILLN